MYANFLSLFNSNETFYLIIDDSQSWSSVDSVPGTFFMPYWNKVWKLCMVKS